MLSAAGLYAKPHTKITLPTPSVWQTQSRPDAQRLCALPSAIPRGKPDQGRGQWVEICERAQRASASYSSAIPFM
jgi:hypothetical protein